MSGRQPWLIYYDDGSVWGGSVPDAPPLGVQAIVQATDDPNVGSGRILIRRFDFYWWDGAEWFGSDLFGLFDYLQRPGYKKVIFGRTIATAAHQAIVDRALAEWDR